MHIFKPIRWPILAIPHTPSGVLSSLALSWTWLFFFYFFFSFCKSSFSICSRFKVNLQRLRYHVLLSSQVGSTHRIPHVMYQRLCSSKAIPPTKLRKVLHQTLFHYSGWFCHVFSAWNQTKISIQIYPLKLSSFLHSYPENCVLLSLHLQYP